MIIVLLDCLVLNLLLENLCERRFPTLEGFLASQDPIDLAEAEQPNFEVWGLWFRFTMNPSEFLFYSIRQNSIMDTCPNIGLPTTYLDGSPTAYSRQGVALQRATK